MSQEDKKIGIICNVYGPLYIQKEMNVTGNYINRSTQSFKSAKDDRFYNFFEFYKKNIRNPYVKMNTICDSVLNASNYDHIVILDSLVFNEKEFPLVTANQENDYFLYKRNLHTIADKYNLAALIFITGAYGFELEKNSFVNGRKKNVIYSKIFFINLKTNELIRKDKMNLHTNIHSWNQSPDYSTLFESYSELLDNEILPSLSKIVLKLIKGY